MFVVLFPVCLFSQGQGLHGNPSSPRRGQQCQGTLKQKSSLRSEWLRVAVIACNVSIKDLAAPTGRLDPLCKKRATLLLRGWWSQRKLIAAEGGAYPEEPQWRLTSVVQYGINHCSVFVFTNKLSARVAMYIIAGAPFYHIRPDYQCVLCTVQGIFTSELMGCSAFRVFSVSSAPKWLSLSTSLWRCCDVWRSLNYPLICTHTPL